MPWRLVAFVLVLAIVVAFIGLNLGNTTAISFGFATLEGVPVFLSLGVAFVLGALAAIPITVATLRRRKQKELRKPSNKNDLPPTVEVRGRRGRRNKETQPEEPAAPEASEE